MKKKKKIATKKKSKPELADEILFELEGQVFIIGMKNGKEIERTPLDGNVVLQCLISTLTSGMDLMENKNVSA